MKSEVLLCTVSYIITVCIDVNISIKTYSYLLNHLLFLNYFLKNNFDVSPFITPNQSELTVVG